MKRTRSCLENQFGTLDTLFSRKSDLYRRVSSRRSLVDPEERLDCSLRKPLCPPVLSASATATKLNQRTFTLL
ncbi:hypothetical protein WN51_02057 [Melipona quadrifasciata]|uniref:Uncharacterized protein n=1 Tax=Melipona quadrifasciata TaxID=166423 RepID=A0A0M8ZYZ4_9HYME|nr:hypothetical protein WN51_02057 [Melipona quadrifasciata]